MTKEDIKHLQWIYHRMRDVHEENENYDYMIKFRGIIEKTKNVNFNIVDTNNNSTLKNNRGMIVFSREFLIEHPTEEFLKAMFSNFFPVATEIDHTFYPYHTIKMFGYSKHFREISEGEVIPEYEIVMIQDENGIRFDKMVERHLSNTLNKIK